ncbi:CCA tRNA nucleotidyltransferase [Thermodesulfobacteriota bacterium]
MTTKHHKKNPDNVFQKDIPKFVIAIIEQLQNKGFQAYVVGGSIRDMLLNRPVMDWDVATSASPDEIRSLFQNIRNFTLKHETVTLVDSGKLYELTTFRDSGSFSRNIKEDLGHRDFTINAMAYDLCKKAIVDPKGGREDLIGKLVRAVGDPNERFKEDPLRLLRAVRISAELEFTIERRTMEAINKLSGKLAFVSRERVRDELMKILLSKRPSKGFSLMRRTGLLKELLPELLEGFMKKQNAYHRYTIYRHIMETINRVEPDPILRLTALLHDIAKPRVRQKIKGEFRFYKHAEASALLAWEIMERLRFSKGMIRKVTHLIALHMIMYDSKWGDGAVRRFMRRAGREHIEPLLSFRRADLSAHGFIDKKMDLLLELEKRVGELKEKSLVMDVRDLAVGGKIIMNIMGLSAGPDVGKTLEILMEKVTDHPELNNEDGLINLLKEMRNN